MPRRQPKSGMILSDPWKESDQEAFRIALAAQRLPPDASPAEQRAIAARAEALGYADRVLAFKEKASPDGRTWTRADAGDWFDLVNDAYDQGMNRAEAGRVR